MSGSFGVPPDVQRIEYDKVTTFADWEPTDHDGPGETVGGAEAHVSSEQFNVMSLASGYSYKNSQLRRAQRLNVDLESTKATGVMTSAQITLDKLAALGSDGLNKGRPSAKTGIYGLFNHPEVAISTLGATSESWADQIATDPDAGRRAVIQDFLAWEAIIEQTTLENVMPDTVVLPVDQAAVFREPHGFSETTLESSILNITRFIQRIEYWDRGAVGSGVGGLRRGVCFASRDPRVARVVIPQEPTPEAPYQYPYSVFTPMVMQCAGMVTKLPEGLSYLDMADDA